MLRALVDGAFRGLGQVARIEIEDVVIADAGVRLMAAAQVPHRLKQAATNQPGIGQAEFRQSFQQGSVTAVAQGILHKTLRQIVHSARRVYSTLAMDAQTWAMFWLFSAATHMRPVSVP